MSTIKPVKITLLQTAINKAGILQEVIDKATPDCASMDLVAWLKEHPSLKPFNIQWPTCMSTFRRRLGCPAKPGGYRGVAPSYRYNVRGLR